MAKKIVAKKNSQVKIKDSFSLLNEAASLGFVIALPPVLLAFLGIFIDKTFNTKPIFTIGFIFFGTVIGTISALRETNKLTKKE